jgi:hypothetical protein
MTLNALSINAASTGVLTGPFVNYLITPLLNGNTPTGLTVQDIVGNTGKSTFNSSVQYLTFSSGSSGTSFAVQNLTSDQVILSSDAHVIAVDPSANAAIMAGGGEDIIFGGANNTIYGGKGTTTVAFVSDYSNFEVKPIYGGKNGAFSGFTIKDRNMVGWGLRKLTQQLSF